MYLCKIIKMNGNESHLTNQKRSTDPVEFYHWNKLTQNYFRTY